MKMRSTSRLASWRKCAVALFVSWHLFFRLVRNPADLWYEDSSSEIDSVVQPVLGSSAMHWIDRSTSSYGDWCGVVQGWSMFSSPLARSASFLAVRIEFADGTSTELRSLNEPADPVHFFRVGGWRQRKFEDRLNEPKHFPVDPTTRVGRACCAYVRSSLRRWRTLNPNDERSPARLQLLERRIDLPAPGNDPANFAPAEEISLGWFDPEGNPQ